MIRFVDLAADLAEVDADVRRRIDGVLARTQFVLGPETAELEDAMRVRLGAARAVAVSSGSDALSLALLALGIGAGDAVVVPSFTFFATAGAVLRAGAQPVFCDIEPASFLAGATQMQSAVGREFERVAGAWRHRTSGARLAAFLPVHLYGRACEMDAILALASETGARVIEDAAQAVGCRQGGVSVGCFGDAGCFSFYPTKNLGGAGDGGLVSTRDEALGARIAQLRSHGSEPGSYEHAEAGINARMPELVAAVLNAKLVRLHAWTARRRQLAAKYTHLLEAAHRSGTIGLSPACDEQAHVWHQYAVRIPASGGSSARRERVQARLEQSGIPTRVFYPLPLHRQPCFSASGGAAGALPEADAAAAEVLCLPIHPSLTDEDVERVTESLVAAARNA